MAINVLENLEILESVKSLLICYYKTRCFFAFSSTLYVWAIFCAVVVFAPDGDYRLVALPFGVII